MADTSNPPATPSPGGSDAAQLLGGLTTTFTTTELTSPQHQSQIICTGCGTLLVFPQGASNVRCALCNNITPVPPAGTEMAQLECGGCRTLLMYVRGASSVQCAVCNTVNLAVAANQIAHLNCSGCSITLMYAYGAQSVKCALCNIVTSVAAAGAQAQRLHDSASGGGFVAPIEGPPSMVVVENPPSEDENGKLVNNIAVGVATG